MSSKLASFALVAVLAAAAGCASDPTAPTPDLINPSLEVYSGPMDPGGLNTYLFTTNQRGSIELMLAGVIVTNPFRSLSPVLRLTISQWNGTECVPVVEADTVPRLTASLRTFSEGGTYCAAVSDPHNNLTQPVGVILRMVSPAIVRTGAEPGTVTFNSTITPTGTTTRSFITGEQGMVSVTLEAITGDHQMGLGIGIGTSSGCRIVQTVWTRPGPTPQLTARADAGQYCVAVFDIGNLVRTESFSVKFSYP